MTADAGITKNVSFHTSRHTTQVYADVIMETKVEPLAEFQIIFLTCKIRGCAVNLNYDTAPIFSSSLYFICSFTWIIFSDNHILGILHPR